MWWMFISTGCAAARSTATGCQPLIETLRGVGLCPQRPLDPSMRSAAWRIFAMGDACVRCQDDGGLLSCSIRFVATDIHRRTDAWLTGREWRCLPMLPTRTPNDALYNVAWLAKLPSLRQHEIPNRHCLQTMARMKIRARPRTARCSSCNSAPDHAASSSGWDRVMDAPNLDCGAGQNRILVETGRTDIAVLKGAPRRFALLRCP